MEHAGIAHGTLSVPILPRLLHKHLLLRVTAPGQPCFLIRSRTPFLLEARGINAQILAAPGFEHFHSCSTKCNVSAKMEHAGIAHGTTVGLSVPILPRLLHKHLLLRVTRPGQPCFLIRSRTATPSKPDFNHELVGSRLQASVPSLGAHACITACNLGIDFTETTWRLLSN